MAEDILKIEANSEGVWISALSDDITLAQVNSFLHGKGVRKYSEKAVLAFSKEKNRVPQKIAGRSELDEKGALITVQIARDSMSVTVTVEPPFFTKPWPSVADIEASLARKNVTFGVDKEAIKKLVELQIADDSVTVAQGRPSRNGENARVELLVDPDHAPQIDLDAQKIDHRTRSIFLNVRQGQEIAIKHPSTPGTEGMSVLGTAIKASPGKDAAFAAGGGLEISEDGTRLTAAIDGRLAWKDKKLYVQPELEVKGDVDFGVGNIDFSGSVKIMGSVREGFRVVAGGNIEVSEVVEGAYLESAQDIIVRGGVRGMGKGRIIAGGNVTIGFADQAYIRSRGDVKAKDSIFHSDVAAQRSITVMGGQRSQIAGGKYQAGLEVICQTLGSEMGTKTEIVVGIPPDQVERRKELQAAISQHKDNVEKLEANLAFLKKQEAAGTLDEKKRALMATATKSKFQLQSALQTLTDEMEEIDARLELTKAKGVVRIKDVCYSGVSITIRGVVYAVKESFKYAAFVNDDGEVRLRAFDA